jgi:hypothetical protein
MLKINGQIVRTLEGGYGAFVASNSRPILHGPDCKPNQCATRLRKSEEGQGGAVKTDNIRHGAVCEICGRAVTETEYSYGASNCCQGNIVPQEEYDRGLPDEDEIEARVRAGVGAYDREFNRPRPRRKDRIIEDPYTAATAARVLQDIGTDKGKVIVPCRHHLAQLHNDIEWCREEGLQFTAYSIGLLAYGEENEKREKFQSYPSFPVLDKTIGTILDGCKNCKAEVRR